MAEVKGMKWENGQVTFAKYTVLGGPRTTSHDDKASVIKRCKNLVRKGYVLTRITFNEKYGISLYFEDEKTLNDPNGMNGCYWRVNQTPGYTGYLEINGKRYPQYWYHGRLVPLY